MNRELLKKVTSQIEEEHAELNQRRIDVDDTPKFWDELSWTDILEIHQHRSQLLNMLKNYDQILDNAYNALNALSFRLTIGTKLHHDQSFTPMSHEHIKHEVDNIMEMMAEDANTFNLMEWFDATMNQIEKDEYEIEERMLALQERKENAISKVWPEFDPLRYKLSSWSCEKSPIHMCAYDLLLEPNDPSWGECIFCEQPEK